MSLKSRLTAILAVGCVSFLTAPGFAQAGDKWGAWTEFGGFGANRSQARRGEATLWAPLLQDERSLLFTDISGRFFADDAQEGNVALGYRTVGDDGWNPGFWIGYDRRHSDYDTDFNQISLGFEALSPDWDFRLNGYAPLNNSERLSTSTTGGSLEVIDNDLLFVPRLSTLYELAFWGVDVEIGYRIPLERRSLGAVQMDEPASTGRHHDLRVYAGAYYFENTDFDEAIAGPRLRAEWRIENIFDDWDGSRLTFEAAWQHDDTRDSQFEAGLRLRIPLGGRSAGASPAPLSPQERRMTEGLKRDRDVVTQTRLQRATVQGPPEPVEDAVTGVDFDSIGFVANGADVNAAIARAGGNALLVAHGGAANFARAALLPNQTLLGGGGLLPVRSQVSGIVLTYAAPGRRPTFQSQGFTGAAIALAHNGHIKDVSVLGNGAPTIPRNAGPGRGQVPIPVDPPSPLSAIADVVVGSNQTVVLDGVTITNNQSGITLSGTGSSITVRNSTISEAIFGIIVGGQDNTVVMENNVFRNIGRHALSISENPQGTTRSRVAASDNRFEGRFGSFLFSFGVGNTTLLAGSTGNVDASTGSTGLCIRDGNPALAGSIAFTGGIAVDQSSCAP